MRLFPEQRELIQFARGFILGRVASLENDVNRCLCQRQNDQYDPAPFPALLYCFATIDLLGALYSGNAKPGRTSSQSREYMEKFMGYTSKQAKLLQDLFRHKLVHLAQPNPIIKYGSGYVSWYLYHQKREKHLEVEKETRTKRVTSVCTIECDYVFYVSILDLVKDIRASVEKPTGYLASLETKPDLQDRFEQAIAQIYDYE
jgi:hypothetical protein